jgi:hypothetical protein
MITIILYVLAFAGIGLLLFYGATFIIGFISMPFVASYKFITAKNDADKKESKKLFFAILFAILSCALLTAVILMK